MSILSDKDIKIVVTLSKIIRDYLGEGYEQPAYDMTALICLKFKEHTANEIFKRIEEAAKDCAGEGGFILCSESRYCSRWQYEDYFNLSCPKGKALKKDILGE